MISFIQTSVPGQIARSWKNDVFSKHLWRSWIDDVINARKLTSANQRTCSWMHSSMASGGTDVALDWSLTSYSRRVSSLMRSCCSRLSMRMTSWRSSTNAGRWPGRCVDKLRQKFQAELLYSMFSRGKNLAEHTYVVLEVFPAWDDLPSILGGEVNKYSYSYLPLDWESIRYTSSLKYSMGSSALITTHVQIN